MLDIDLARSGDYSAGLVLASSWRVAWRNIGAVLLISIAVQALRAVADPPSGDLYIGFEIELRSAGDVWRALFRLLSYAFVTASITHLVLHDLASSRPGVIDTFKGGFRRIVRVAFGGIGLAIAIFVPMIAVVSAAHAVGLPGAVGFLTAAVLVAPVVTSLFVLIPSLASDNVGYFDSFRRSAALTKGRRWSVLALLLIASLFLLVSALLLYAAAMLVLMLLPPLPMNGMIAPVVLFDALYCVVWAILPAVAFHYLRTERDGLDPASAGQVFD